MRRHLNRFFTVVGAITSGLLALWFVLWGVTCATRDRVPERTVIELHLDQRVTEGSVLGPLAELVGGGGTTVFEVVEGLERAGTDERVAGMIVYIDDVSWGLARSQEIRDAILRFRERGKFAVAFAETFGELSPGNQGYYVATACDEVWLQPSGGLGLVGLMAESYFLRGALELARVEPEGGHRKEYKNAFNIYTERRYTEAHREATETLLQDYFTQIVDGIAQARGLESAQLRALVDRGPFLSDAAVEHGLVDGTAYRDQVVDKVRERAGEGAELLYFDVYRERSDPAWDEGRRVALITAEGTVSRGDSAVDPVAGDQALGSDTVTAAFRTAIADEKVEAIVFRIDTPGGSPVASDAIWREMKRAREAGKPVIVSMGNAAASGGYYIASAATKIVAQPATVTGSIGVLGGKPVTMAAWNRVGVTWDYVKTSTNADLHSHLTGYSAEGREALDRWLDSVYEDFTGKVAEGRGMSGEEVETIAKGRVWSGARAAELGLVDALGGLPTAIELAKSEAGIPADASIELVRIPKSEGLLSQLFDEGPPNSDGKAAGARVSVERWRDMATALHAAGLAAEDPGVLTMPPLTVSR